MFMYLSMCGRVASAQPDSKVCLGNAISLRGSVARSFAFGDGCRIAGVIARAAVVHRAQPADHPDAGQHDQAARSV